VKPKDIIITGSLANFNWNEKYSDIDLHVLLDYNKVDKRKDFVSNYFYTLKKQWNEEHEDLKIFGFPVEVYVQDVNETHTASGVYSLEKNEWIEEPKRDKLAKVKVNKTNIKKEVSIYTEKIDNLIKLFKENKKDKHKLEQISKKAEHIFNEIKSNRRNSLNGKNTEITEDNIIFKSLRRLGYIDKIVKIISDSYNILNSLP
jgi:ribosomal protein S15P/S13E